MTLTDVAILELTNRFRYFQSVVVMMIRMAMIIMMLMIGMMTMVEDCRRGACCVSSTCSFSFEIFV